MLGGRLHKKERDGMAGARKAVRRYEDNILPRCTRQKLDTAIDDLRGVLVPSTLHARSKLLSEIGTHPRDL